MSPKLTRSPTALSQMLLELEGCLVGRTEAFIPGAYRKRDLFGFVDLCYVKGETTGFVQTTDVTHLANREAKLNGLEDAAVIANAVSRRIEVHGWVYLGRGLFHCRRLHWLPNERTETQVAMRQNTEKGAWELLGPIAVSPTPERGDGP